MASMTEPIIVQIVNESGMGNVKSAGGTKGGGGGGGGGASFGAKNASLAGGISKLVGMGAIIVEVMKIIGEALNTVIKPIKMMLTGIFKLVAQLLRPIADVIVLLLMPFLAFLKPIIKVFNEIMRPYRVLAYRMMKTATTTTDPVRAALLGVTAIQTIFLGFTMAILGVIKEIIKTQIAVIGTLLLNFVINPLLTVFGGLIGFFTGQTTKELKDNAKIAMDAGVVFINAGIDKVFDTINASAFDLATATAAVLAVDLSGLNVGPITQAILNLGNKVVADATAGLRNQNRVSGGGGVTSVAWTSAGGTQYGTYTQNGQGFSGVIPGTSSYDRAKAIFSTNAKV